MYLKENIINSTVNFVKEELKNAEGGHDWWHIYRVWKLAKTIAKLEDVDMFVVELGALLHDIADSKFHNGDEEVGPKKAKSFLDFIGVPGNIIDKVVLIIENISFKGQKNKKLYISQEFNVVQDADRLDALGAIGIARTFNYGGFKNREIYNPNIKPKLNMTKEEYKNNEGVSINHFYEKLLLLKNLMNTETGLKIAEKRHIFMEEYLEQFYKEREGIL